MITASFPGGHEAVLRDAGQERPIALENPSWDAAMEKVIALNQAHTADGTPLSSAMNWRGFEPWWFGQDQLLRNILLPSMRYRPLLDEAIKGRGATVVDPPKDFGWMPAVLRHAGVICKVERRQFRRWEGLRNEISGAGLKLAVSLGGLMVGLVSPGRIVLTAKKPVDTADPLRCDRRFREIYSELNRRKLSFIEMIFSVRNFDAWQEQARRRRLGIYTYQLSRCAGWVLRKPARPPLRSEPADPVDRATLEAYWGYSAENMRRAAVLRFLLLLLRPSAVLTHDAMQEISPLVAAAKSLSIPTVCFQHGVNLPNFHAGIFCYGRRSNGARNHGADTCFVRADYDADKLLRLGRLYTRQQIRVGGPIRPIPHAQSRPRLTSRPVKVLWVGETLAHAEEARPFVEAICRISHFEVKYRPRPERTMTAKQSNMIRDWGLNIKFSRDRTLQEDLDGSHVVIGTYSTVLLECYARMVPSVYMRVPTDLVGFDDMAQSGLMVASSPEELATDIEKAAALSDEELLRLQHFLLGPESKSGSRSIMDHLETLLHRT